MMNDMRLQQYLFYESHRMSENNSRRKLMEFFLKVFNVLFYSEELEESVCLFYLNENEKSKTMAK